MNILSTMFFKLFSSTVDVGYAPLDTCQKYQICSEQINTSQKCPFVQDTLRRSKNVKCFQ